MNGLNDIQRAGREGAAVATEGLHKRFGKTHALRGVDLLIPPGTVCALLGPNGAGKTTVVRILATLLRPDAGQARVVGYDVVRDAEQLRYRIGLAGQYAAVDELLTGRANLEMVGRLYHLPARMARRRADDLLQRFALTAAAQRLVKTYSGGMRRRLDLAASMVVAPPVLFLDEPTTGLDPRSRNAMWGTIRELVADGTTLLLTTQYLDEADQLADQVAVIDNGQVVGSGTPNALKARIGGEQIEIIVSDTSWLSAAASALRRAVGAEPRIAPDLLQVSVAVVGSAAALLMVARELDAARIPVVDIMLRRATLDDVFLQLTGHAAVDEIQDDANAGELMLDVTEVA